MTAKYMRYTSATLIVILILLSSCTSSQSASSNVQPTSQLFAVTIYPTDTSTAPPAATERSASIPVSTPVPSTSNTNTSDCPVPALQTPVSPQMASFSDTIPALLGILNAGAALSDTEKALKDWGVIYVLPETGQVQGVITHATFTRGSDQQLVIIYYDPLDTKLQTRKSEILVLRCKNRQYSVIYRATDDPELAGQVTNARLLSINDVLGDGNAELSYTLEDCSENTCFDGLYVLKEVNNAFVNVIPDIEWSPFPTFQYRPSGRSGSQAQDIVIHIGLLAPLGAGPQRTITDTWTYDGQQYTHTLSIIEPPSYRIHALMDGDKAFRTGKLDLARSYYQQVVDDSSLLSWAGNAPLRDEPHVLAAFAMLRMMQISGLVGDVAGVKKTNEEMITLNPTDSAGFIYRQMANVFIANFDIGMDYLKACDAVIAYAEKNKNVFVVLGQDTFGSANYDYQAPDMCIVP